MTDFEFSGDRSSPRFTSKLLVAVFFVQLAWMSFPAAAEPGETRSPAAKILELLESGKIGVGGSDQILRNTSTAISITRNGGYSIFFVEGLDVTDSITMMSSRGKFFYANYGSCSQSKTYFKNGAEYRRYLSQVK